MKQFNHFRKDIDEAAAAVAAIPKIAKFAKLAAPAAMTLVGGVGTYLQSKKDDNKLSNLEIIRQELQRRLQQGPGGKFRRNRSDKFQQTDAELKKKIDEIGKKIKDKKDPK